MEKIEYDIKLLNLLKERGFKKDEIIGCLLHLKTDENWRAMIEFLEVNPKYTAEEGKGRDEIYSERFRILGIDIDFDDDEWEDEEENEEEAKLEKDNKLF